MSTPPGLAGPDADPTALGTRVPVGSSPLSRRPPLIRPQEDRILAGVAAGVAHHLGLPARAVRFGFVIAALLGGPGAVLYAWLWALVPDESSAAAEEAVESMFRQSNRAPYSGGPILGAQIGGKAFPAPPMTLRAGLTTSPPHGPAASTGQLPPSASTVSGPATSAGLETRSGQTAAGPTMPADSATTAGPGMPTSSATFAGPDTAPGPVRSTSPATSTGPATFTGPNTTPGPVQATDPATPTEPATSTGPEASTRPATSTGPVTSTGSTTSPLADPTSPAATATSTAPTYTQPTMSPTDPAAAPQASLITPTAPGATVTESPATEHEADGALIPQTAAEAAQAARVAAVAAAAQQVEKEERSTRRTRLRADLFAGLCLAAAAVVLVASWSGLEVEGGWVLPMLIVASGAVIAYAQFDEADRSRWFSPTGFTTRAATLRLLLGVVLVVLGIVLLVLQNTDPVLLGQTLLATFAVLFGVAVVFAPWGVRFWRALDTERTGRVRETERADIAAHLHDSVLQTLALIQRRSSDGAEVARLARAQERDLRGWLYGGADNDPTMISARVAALAADAEDVHGAVIEVVTVGDRPVDERAISLLSALREAVANAARHAGGESIRVYVECMPDGIEAFVRDRGPGFDLAAVPEDRLGVRESIIGRMERHGGSARIRSTEGEGTEVRLLLPDNGSTEEEK